MVRSVFVTFSIVSSSLKNIVIVKKSIAIQIDYLTIIISNGYLKELGGHIPLDNPVTSGRNLSSKIFESYLKFRYIFKIDIFR